MQGICDDPQRSSKREKWRDRKCLFREEANGAQNNQSGSAESNFLEEIEDNKEAIFISILDGPYYSDKKINEVREQFEKDNIKVCRIEELENTLEAIK